MQLRPAFLSQELLKNMKELEEKKADKQTVEREMVRGFFSFHEYKIIGMKKRIMAAVTSSFCFRKHRNQLWRVRSATSSLTLSSWAPC